MEPSLSLTKNELEGRIGLFFGFGQGSANGDTAWTSSQQAMITASLRSGLRRFYTASGLQDGQSYEWSFLRPLVTLNLLSGGNTVQLPDDYQGLEGDIAISTPLSSVYRPLPVVGVPLVQKEYSIYPNLTGWPRMAAIQPLREQKQGRGQRFELFLFPIADQAYTLQATYCLSPGTIDANHPYPYGGSVHSETILAACKAAAEADFDDEPNGPQNMAYREQLMASVAVDRRNKPQKLGQLQEHSDRRWYGLGRRGIYDNDVVTYTGG